MKKKPAIPFERHQEMARFLKNASATLLDLHAEVLNHRGGNHQKRAGVALFRAKQKLDEARSELEEIMFVDHPDQSDTHIYYGHARKLA